VNPVAKDRAGWVQLLSDHTAIRRTVTFSSTGVEAITVSDDPRVAAMITEHALAMQERVKVGAAVRTWDGVFKDLFEQYANITLRVTPLTNGVKTVEAGADDRTVALIWSHASGVNDFVREGHDIESNPTRRFEPGSPVPPAEVAIGGVRHRFLLTQPDGADIASLREVGVHSVVNFRHEKETPGFDERGATQAAGLGYCHIPFAGAAELTDNVLDAARAALRDFDAHGNTAALHCRTGNRIGPAWAVYRVLDQGIGVEQAIAEAKSLQMIDPAYEAKARDYIRRHTPGTPSAAR